MAKRKNPSNDRRITVLSGLWPRLQKLAEEDDIAVADVVNAILLQSLRPYGICAAVNAFTATSSLPAPPIGAAQSDQPDPYQTAGLDSW